VVEQMIEVVVAEVKIAEMFQDLKMVEDFGYSEQTELVLVDQTVEFG
jgi:hypothetical protein